MYGKFRCIAFKISLTAAIGYSVFIYAPIALEISQRNFLAGNSAFPSETECAVTQLFSEF